MHFRKIMPPGVMSRHSSCRRAITFQSAIRLPSSIGVNSSVPTEGPTSTPPGRPLNTLALGIVSDTSHTVSEPRSQLGTRINQKLSPGPQWLNQKTAHSSAELQLMKTPWPELSAAPYWPCSTASASLKHEATPETRISRARMQPPMSAFRAAGLRFSYHVFIATPRAFARQLWRVLLYAV